MANNSEMATEAKKKIEKIKSKAIVKYSVSKPCFLQLKCNTNLNLPPSNWLSNSVDLYGLERVLHQQKNYSSFYMAHMFPDCIGTVDVISDAENIKELLQLAYNKNHISMIVHRIGNTLLLDKLDIYQYLMKTTEANWVWLRKFFRDKVSHETCEENRSLYAKSRSRDVLREKSLISKFLYHSLSGEYSPIKAKTPPTTVSQQLIEENHNNSTPSPLLPDPYFSYSIPSLLEHKFNRNVVWTFEDIEMLIGTDLPIFGGGTHPCISLRLRDATKPISVLTGIDYWLDNLMSNVPEVIMCYHLNGIVQKYELVKTEDLPKLHNSKFSPNLIRGVAQNILSFLKLNATKAGHTYWLFKGKDEDVVKLYDLTSLCTEKDVGSGQNPFIVPVGMLLYRLARNLKHNMEEGQTSTIQALLKNCIKLLQAEQYPEIVTSSHYMLADLYIPANTNPQTPVFDQQPDNSHNLYQSNEEEEEAEVEEQEDYSTKFLFLDQNNINNTKYSKSNNYQLPSPISGSTEERCTQALQHLKSGFNCLKYFPEISKRHNYRVDDIPMANPAEPIPMMDTERKKRNNKQKLQKQQESTLSKQKHLFWEEHLKILLYEKAILIFSIMAEMRFQTATYGSALRIFGLLARCQLIICKLIGDEDQTKTNYILNRSGDCCMMLVHNWPRIDSYRNQFQMVPDHDQRIMEQFEHDEQYYSINIGHTKLKCVFLYDFLTIEQMLLQSIHCYETSLGDNSVKSVTDSTTTLSLANSLNETGTMYLSKAKNCIGSKELCLEHCRKAELYFKRALEIFEQCKHKLNIALLYFNLGHLQQFLVGFYGKLNYEGALTDKEKYHYRQTFLYYKEALKVIGERNEFPAIWDNTNWNLSTALFNMAVNIQDFPPKHQLKNAIEKDAVEMFQKALHYCDLDEDNPKLPLYQYRAGMIHLRIGRLYHSHIINNENNAANMKRYIQLTRINLEKAAKYFLITPDVLCYFKSQMQQFALFEHLAHNASAVLVKMKHLQHCVEIVIEMNDMFQLIADNKVDFIENDNGEEEQFDNLCTLLKLVKERLQLVLKLLLKLAKSHKEHQNVLVIYKECYKATLELCDGTDCNLLISQFNTVIHQLIYHVHKLNL